MVSRIWGIPPAVAGLAAAGIVLAAGWTCPTGGTAWCSHAYIAGTPLLVLGAGAALLLIGILIVALGGKKSAV